MAQAFDTPHVLPEPASRGVPRAERNGSPADLAQAAAMGLRRSVLDDLREQIRRIERDVGVGMTAREALPAGADFPPFEGESFRSQRFIGQHAGPVWRLGVTEVDVHLGPDGLDIGGIHEIKPTAREHGASWTASWAAAIVFSLILSVRRISDGGGARSVLFCRPTALNNELGSLYGPGLKALGFDSSRLIIVETANAADTLWAMEEGLRSGSLALVLGILDSIELTPARRLALAAAAHRAPCLLLTHPRNETVASTATRWRIGPDPSAPHPFDRHAPGALRFAVDLERCRTRPLSTGTASFSLEWCDEALCFRLAPGVADRADAARRSGRGA